MTNLVPEKRMDRNGVMVTRHVRASKPKTPLELPAPTASGTRLTVDQTEQWELQLVRHGLHVRKEIYEAIQTPKGGLIRVKTNDVDAYAMLSILSPEDTIALIERGIKTVEDARAFLKKHYIQDIEIDREEVTAECIRRGIPARDYLNLCTSSITRNANPTDVIDAAEAFGMEPLANKINFYHDVMSGDIKVEDIREIGPELIASHSHPDDIRYMLRDIKQGRSRLDASQIKTLLERYGDDEDVFSKSVDVAGEFGIKKLSEITNMEAASSMTLHLGTKYKNNAKQKFARVRHYEQMAIACDESKAAGNSISWRSLPYSLSTEMFDAGIDPKTAVECALNNMSAAQYLAVRDHGVAPSISGGWL